MRLREVLFYLHVAVATKDTCMQTLGLLLALSLLKTGYPGGEFLPRDEISQMVVTQNGQVLVVGTRYVVVSDGIDDWFHADVYIARLATDGKTVLWEKTYGSIQDDRAYAIAEYPDGTIQIVGETWSPGNKYTDVYFLLLDSRGTLIWQQKFARFHLGKVETLTVVDHSVIVVGASNRSFRNSAGSQRILCVSHDGRLLWSTFSGDL